MLTRPQIHEDWMSEAVCASVDPEVWFPPKSGSSTPAKRICRGVGGQPGCPVINECLEYALTHDERFGVWGGMSERDRNKIRSGKPVK
jgi:WhiB family transcriptional regulator, redox-sensing transcriptional regulator